MLPAIMSSPTDRPSLRARALSKLYEYTSEMAESHSGTNRGIAAGTAATLLGMSLDREGRKDLTDDEIASIGDVPELSDDKSPKEKSHFIDNFLERMVRHTISDEDQILIEERLRDPERNKKPPLSIRILTHNFKVLSGKMSMFFRLQYGVIHVFTWKKPTRTLSFLVLYTAICLWPHLVLALPLLFLLFQVILPAYNHRHPMRTPELIKVKRRGQLLLDFFNQSLDSSIVMDMISDEYLEHAELHPVSLWSLDSTYMQLPLAALAISTDPIDVNEKIKKKDKTKFVKSQVSLLINMRDLQNLTTDLLKSLDTGEQLWYETLAFKDERLTTFIFYGVAVASSVVLFLGQFIPWRLIFIQGGWALLALCHPNSKLFLLDLKKLKQLSQIKEEQRRASVPEVVVDEPENEKEPKKPFDRHDIIIDDAPEVRVVEVYEIQRKSLSRNEWSFHCYSSRLFDIKDHARLSGKPPTGVNHLLKVIPPPEWKFDIGFENNWGIDTDPLTFLRHRLVDLNRFVVEENDPEGWIYDATGDSDSFQFRRRRLVRDCFRYSRPPKEPSSY